MAKLKHSFAWWAFGNKVEDKPKLLKDAKRLGYDGVEMIGEELWPAVKDAGLALATMGGHKSLTDGLNKRHNHDRIERELKENIAKAKQHGIHALICFSGNRWGVPDAEAIQICADGLKRVAKDAEQAGVSLVLELLNSKVDHQAYQCDRTWWGVEVVRRVESPRVKLLYDIYHMQIMEGDVIRNLRDNIDYIGHFHTAGNPGRKDLDDEQELYYPAIAKAIAGTNYEGYIGQEFSPKGEPVAALAAALKACSP
ncbi:MAG: hydroxypyruvate isomerase [Planctomycetota bacterium]|nr:TIM barrel protein [Planctomycetota bacterium]